jgi:hypothetical protein
MEADSNAPATKADLESVRADVGRVLEAVRELNTRFDKRLDENLETIRNIETNLLTAFHNYARGQQARMHQTEANDRDMLLRLQSLEERMLDLESRFPKRIT